MTEDMQIQHNVDLSQILWYRLGGKAKYFLEAKDKQDIYQALDFIEKNNIKNVFFCGLGSNLIFTKDSFDGAVIRITTDMPTANFTSDDLVSAFAGDTLNTVIQFSLFRQRTGLEWAGGLPGTVGAAVRGNVGAYGGEIKDSLYEAEVAIIDDGRVQTKKIPNKELEFEYRGSIIKQHKGKMIVLSATFDLSHATSEETKVANETYQKNIQTRKDRHPLEYPNCGSVFKNIREPEKVEKIYSVFPETKEMSQTKWYGKIAAAYLIQKLGLQGFRVGNAQVSEKHALFIVNLGDAKAQDVLTIIDTIQQKMQETFGFTLETEVEIIQ